MRIGELAERSGVSRDTIRFYERHGLLRSEAGASATNRYRDYPEENLHMLTFFAQAREAGMSIADLRSLVEARGGTCDPRHAEAVIRAKIAELRERAEQIDRVVGFLENELKGGRRAP